MDWTPYSPSTQLVRSRTCGGCALISVDVEGWWWKWRTLAGHPGRHTESLCGQCFNKVRKLLEGVPRCRRCRSIKLVYDRVGEGLIRVTCEVCAYHQEGLPSIPVGQVELAGAR